MSAEAPTTERKSLTTKRPVANTLEGSTVVQAKRSPQRHVLPAGESRTLCGIDTAKWAETVDVAGEKVNCPLCAKTLKAKQQEEQES